MDHLTLGSSWNHLRALNWASTMHGHLLVLEDDAEPLHNLLPRVQAFIAQHPDDLISYYLGTDTRPHQKYIPGWLDKAHTEGRDWISHPELLHGVAYSIPCHMIDTLNFNQRRVADAMIGQAYPTPTLYTIPSYVNHRDDASIENRPRTARRAWRT